MAVRTGVYRPGSVFGKARSAEDFSHYLDEMVEGACCGRCVFLGIAKLL